MKVDGTAHLHATFSMRQALKLAVAGDRLARRMSKEGVLPHTGLLPAHILALKCFTYTDGLPSDKPWTKILKHDLVEECLNSWDKIEISTYFLISNFGVRRIEKSSPETTLWELLGLHHQAGFLLLPVGAWKIDIFEAIAGDGNAY